MASDNDTDGPQGKFWTLPESAANRIIDSALENSRHTYSILPLFQYPEQGILELFEHVNGYWALQVIEQPAWDFYKPAFRLASRLLSSSQLLEWCNVIHRGYIDNNNGEDRDSPNQTLFRPTGDYDQSLAATTARLHNLSEITISFQPIAMNTGTSAWATTTRHGSIHIQLETEFLNFARLIVYQRIFSNIAGGMSTDLVNRVQWMLAIVLCREMTHAFWLRRDSEGLNMARENVTHPAHCLDPRSPPGSDLESAWEYYMFGFRVLEVNIRELLMRAKTKDEALALLPDLEMAARHNTWGGWSLGTTKLQSLLCPRN